MLIVFCLHLLKMFKISLHSDLSISSNYTIERIKWQIILDV